MQKRGEDPEDEVQAILKVQLGVDVHRLLTKSQKLPVVAGGYVYCERLLWRRLAQTSPLAPTAFCRVPLSRATSVQAVALERGGSQGGFQAGVSCAPPLQRHGFYKDSTPSGIAKRVAGEGLGGEVGGEVCGRGESDLSQ